MKKIFLLFTTICLLTGCMDMNDTTQPVTATIQLLAPDGFSNMNDMAGMTVTEERLKNVNFSTSYAKGIQSVIVPEDSEYTSFEDFYAEFDEEGNPKTVKEGIKIGVQQDTTGDIYCSDEPAKWGFGEDNVVRYKTGADAVQALKSGKVTAVIIDNEPAKSYEADDFLTNFSRDVAESKAVWKRIYWFFEPFA